MQADPIDRNRAKPGFVDRRVILQAKVQYRVSQSRNETRVASDNVVLQFDLIRLSVIRDMQPLPPNTHISRDDIILERHSLEIGTRDRRFARSSVVGVEPFFSDLSSPHHRRVQKRDWSQK